MRAQGKELSKNVASTEDELPPHPIGNSAVGIARGDRLTLR